VRKGGEKPIIYRLGNIKYDRIKTTSATSPARTNLSRPSGQKRPRLVNERGGAARAQRQICGEAQPGVMIS